MHARSLAEIVDHLCGNTTRTASGCWLWNGQLNGNGYAKVTFQNRSWLGHRLVYLGRAGSISAGQSIDHRCHNESDCQGGPDCAHRRCQNPAHLEAVTSRENTMRSANTPASVNIRKSQCRAGHPLDEANTYRVADGRRQCRACNRDAQRRRRSRMASA